MISSFRGKYTIFSNYYIGSVWYKDKMYPSAEHAYQAQKSLSPDVQQIIRNQPTPNAAKKIARGVTLRKDWEDVKLSIMEEILREKFSQEPARTVLLLTNNEELIEGNYWGDTYWGQCPVGNGQNHLGKLLMKIRDEQLNG